MNIKFTPRASSRIEFVSEWWRTERPDASGLFLDELNAALRQIEFMPNSGQIYPRKSYQVRRVLLPRTRNHLYYRVHVDHVEVLGIWSAVTERSPRL